MTLRQEREKSDRAMKSPKKKRDREAKELRKELKNSPLRSYYENTPNHGQGLGKTDREED